MTSFPPARSMSLLQSIYNSPTSQSSQDTPTAIRTPRVSSAPPLNAQVIQPRAMQWFIEELIQRSDTPVPVVCAALAYITAAGPAIRRAIEDKSDPDCPLLDPRRVYLAAIILGSKFLIDTTYNNKSWATVSGLEVLEVSRCERTLGEALRWRLWVGKPVVSAS
jgi:hypothetical protein